MQIKIVLFAIQRGKYFESEYLSLVVRTLDSTCSFFFLSFFFDWTIYSRELLFFSSSFLLKEHSYFVPYQIYMKDNSSRFFREKEIEKEKQKKNVSMKLKLKIRPTRTQSHEKETFWECKDSMSLQTSDVMLYILYFVNYLPCTEKQRDAKNWRESHV